MAYSRIQRLWKEVAQTSIAHGVCSFCNAAVEARATFRIRQLDQQQLAVLQSEILQRLRNAQFHSLPAARVMLQDSHLRFELWLHRFLLRHCKILPPTKSLKPSSSVN